MPSQTTICVDVGGSFIKFAVSTTPGHIELLEQHENPADSWDAFVHVLKALIERYKSHYSVDSPVAISTTGVIDSLRDTILAGNIPAYQGHAVKAELESELNRRVYLANDADCFTLAESKLSNAEQHPIVLGVILGTGVGGGLVINGQIIEGKGGITAEWGHGPITQTHIEIDGAEYDLPRLACGCGQTGCLDTYGGARGMERLHQILHGEFKPSIEIVNDWHQGKTLAEHTILVWVQLVSEPLAFTLNVLGASKVVVGGGLSSDRDLISLLDDQVRSKILINESSPIVVPGSVSQHGGLIGASWLPHSR